MGLSSLHRFLRSLLWEEDVDYDQFESRMDGTDIVMFRENDKAFRLFRTNVHVKMGAYIACLIGFAVTIFYCISYTFYHSRGMGRNPFIDHLELVDLIFAFLVGLPCHAILFLGIRKEKKLFFIPFLIFYCTNFMLNVIFTVITIIAAIFDFHQKLFGNVRWDLGWTLFQILFTAAQGLAIYVVIRCRKYVAMKTLWKQRNAERNNNTSSIIADGVTIENA
ncbi:unnamed protein product, partial [Mesorhabditis belari]|uniref:Uncharacterized protein n=1 Tax=Mesorhabditis belari TaxID=2138241 RepID=A0AAF3EVA4_9BILA